MLSYRFLIFSFLLAFIVCGLAHAQSFATITTNLPPLNHAASAWGDYDNDGDLDLALSGALKGVGNVTRIYRNDKEVFTDIQAGLVDTQYGSLAWGDYDNDGDLDLLVTGQTALVGTVTILYRNDSGTFVNSGADLTGVSWSSVAWGDYDNDGSLDLAIFGFVSAPSTYTAKLYHNDGKGSFVDTKVLLEGLCNCGVAWVDYDNDGDLDLSVVGGYPKNESCIYRNDGGAFTRITAGLPQLMIAATAWGDYDNDGDLDVAIGQGDYPSATKVYRNENGEFVDSGMTLSGNLQTSLAWGDYDNDGDLDLLAGGCLDSVGKGRIFRNNSGTLVDSGIALNITGNSINWGDYDADGDLDLVTVGNNSCIIYKSRLSIANTPPTAPSGLSAQASGCTVTFSWEASTDAETKPSGLSYNLRVGTAPGKDDIFSSMSSSPSGRRLVNTLGNVQANLKWTLSGLPKGTLYWSVQAIDSAFTGSAWAEEQIVSMDCRKISGRVVAAGGAPIFYATIDVSNSGSLYTSDKDGYYEIWVPTGWSGTITPRLAGYNFGPASYSYTDIREDQTNQDFTGSGGFQSPMLDIIKFAGGNVAWGDYDNDGDLDFAYTDKSGYINRFKIIRNDNKTFTDANISLPNIGGNVAWGDYDNDGDLDIAIIGDGSETGSPVYVSKILRNENGVFTDINAGLKGMSGVVAWVDYDNDGDLDLMISGNTNDYAGYSTKIYRNEKGTFVEAQTGIPSKAASSISWGDYDKDGDLDLAVCWVEPYYLSAIYRNDNGTFVDIKAGLVNIGSGTISWGDYDNDGDLDLAVIGSTDNSISSPAKIYHNDNGSFVDTGASLPIVFNGSLAWGDYDNDGDLDLIISGISSGTQSICKLYRNNQGVFVDSGLEFIPMKPSSSTWGDYDNDGDLDLLISGYSSAGSRRMYLYRNDSAKFNTVPATPKNLAVQITDAGTKFSWSASIDSETPASGLTYNLRIGTKPGASDVFSGMATSSGSRLIPNRGNAQSQLLWNLQLPAKIYYWSVQAIDSAFAGSAWAEEQFVVPDSYKVGHMKFLGDGYPTSCSSAIVTAVFGDVFYVESNDRSSGIRVEKAGHNLSVGQSVSIIGKAATNTDKEMYIAAEKISVTGSGQVAPLAMNNASLGGRNFMAQKAIWSWRWVVQPDESVKYVWSPSTNMSNIGLLIKTWGRVTRVGEGFFYIDDGSALDDGTGNKGVKVYGSIPVKDSEDPVDKVVTVIGISSCETLNTDPVSVVRTRSSDDVDIVR